MEPWQTFDLRSWMLTFSDLAPYALSLTILVGAIATLTIAPNKPDPGSHFDYYPINTIQLQPVQITNDIPFQTIPPEDDKVPKVKDAEQDANSLLHH